MRQNMIINGIKLGEYLDKHNVSRSEFLASITEGDIKEHFNDEDYVTEYYRENLDLILESDLFSRYATLNYEVSKNLIELIGADDAFDIIDWEAMGFNEPPHRPTREIGRGFYMLFKALAMQNAYQGYTV